MLDRESRIPRMTEIERQRISDYIEKQFGIKMPAVKKSLLEGRLAKRLLACGCASYSMYFQFITQDPAGKDEFLRFADLVSTHETSFFREARHFHLLSQSVLPQLCAQEDRRTITVLSAACSTGEEAYTLGMLIDSALKIYKREDISFSIEGIDLSSHAVAIAQRGVYLSERTSNIPQNLQHQYLMLNKDRKKKLCRFVPELRRTMFFHTGNLLGNLELTHRTYDIVFCRNVLIYFNHENQQKVITTLLKHMSAKALLFLGHSETLSSFNLPVRSIAPAVFQKM